MRCAALTERVVQVMLGKKDTANNGFISRYHLNQVLPSPVSLRIRHAMPRADVGEPFNETP